MMIKRLLLLCLAVLFVFSLLGCNVPKDRPSRDDDNDDNDSSFDIPGFPSLGGGNDNSTDASRPDNDDKADEEVKVENFVGKNLNDVIHNEVYLDKYTFDEVIEYYDDSPAGTIIKQDPGKDRVEKVKCSVKLWVSKGPLLVEIPMIDIGEDTVEDATRKLKIAGFKWQMILQHHNTIPEDFVIKLEPAYPNTAKEGSTVTIYVSNGPKPLDPIQMPNLIGVDLKNAESLLTASNLVLDQENIIYRNAPGAIKGQVIGQSIAPDVMAYPDAEVVLTVASGYSDVKVTVPLPNENIAVDLMVYINNRASSDPKYSNLNGILVRHMRSVSLDFTEQLAQYSVAIFIRESGVNALYEPYLEYTVNGVDGTVVLDKAYDVTF